MGPVISFPQAAVVAFVGKVVFSRCRVAWMDGNDGSRRCQRSCNSRKVRSKFGLVEHESYRAVISKFQGGKQSAPLHL